MHMLFWSSGFTTNSSYRHFLSISFFTSMKMLFTITITTTTTVTITTAFGFV